LPKDEYRHHYVKATVMVHHYSEGHLAVFYGHRCLGYYEADGQLMEKKVKEAA